MINAKDAGVEFRFHHTQARSVEIVGDFTGWRRGIVRMNQEADGTWMTALPLEPGIYHFRYLADGEWFVDPSTCRVDDGPFGVDSVIWVLPNRTLAAYPARPTGLRPAGRPADARVGAAAPPRVRTRSREMETSRA